MGGEDFEVEDGAEEGLEAMGEILYLRKVSRTLPVSAVKFKYSWRACQQGPRSRSWFSTSQQSGRSRWTDSVGSPGFTSTRIKRPARYSELSTSLLSPLTGIAGHGGGHHHLHGQPDPAGGPADLPRPELPRESNTSQSQHSQGSHGQARAAWRSWWRPRTRWRTRWRRQGRGLS